LVVGFVSPLVLAIVPAVVVAAAVGKVPTFVPSVIDEADSVCGWKTGTRKRTASFVLLSF
jgi:hypothetical protein